MVLKSRALLKPLSVTVATLAIASLVACSGSEAPTAVPGGTLNWGIEGANLADGHMDPHASQLDVSAYVNRATLDSLVYMNSKGELKPWLASSWTVSDDGKTYTFALRNDVTFSDGTAFDAHAVKANFDHIMAEETESAQASSMLGDDLYVESRVIDPSTVAVSFSAPFAPFLANASTAFLGMYSPSVLALPEAKLKAGGPDVSIGSGPFVMKEYEPNDHITYSRNAEYAWAPEGYTIGKNAIETLNIEIVPKTSIRLSSLESGELDLATGLTPNVLEGVPDDIKVTPVASPGLPYSLFLNQKNGVFADPLVREAFAYGINIGNAVESVYFGQYDQAWSILSPTTPNSYDASLEGQLKFDAKKAAQLLDEAGWTETDSKGYRTKDGETLSATWYSWTPISEEHKNLAALFTADLKEIGFKLDHRVVEPAVYNEHYGDGTFDITDWDFASADANILRQHLHSTGFQNASYVADDELDALLDDAASSTDSTKRAELYAQIQQWNAEHLAIVPVYTSAFIDAQAKTAQNIGYDLFGWPIFIAAETSHTE